MLEARPVTILDLPDGDYAIVEMLGHRTMVGRVAEVERFGTKMLQIEALYGDLLLPPILVGGGSIYQLTPIDKHIAWERRTKRLYNLPDVMSSLVPAVTLEQVDFLKDDDDDTLTF